MPVDEPLLRLLDFHGRTYWLVNGWSIRLSIVESPVSKERPHGIRYSLTLHDVDGTRLLGFDNATGRTRRMTSDHWHPFRRTEVHVPYESDETELDVEEKNNDPPTDL